MLSLPFIRDNPDAVRKAIADKNVALDLDALLALDGEVRALKTRVDALRAERNAISDGFKSAAPEERPALGAKAKAIGAEIGEVEAALGEQAGGARRAAAARAQHPLGGRAGRAGRELQRRRPAGRDDPRLRFRAARPCRPDREERLGRSGADHPGGGLAHLLPEGPAGAARTGADALGAEAARRRRLHPDDRAGARPAAGLRRHRPFPGPRGRGLSYPGRRPLSRRHRRDRADLACIRARSSRRTSSRSSMPAIRPASAARRGAPGATCAGCCASTNSTSSNNM